jgi:hypothetical protein
MEFVAQNFPHFSPPFDEICIQNISVETLREETEHLDLDQKIMFEYVLQILGVRVWTGFDRLRIGSFGGSFEFGSEHSGFYNVEEFLDHLSDCHILMRDSASRSWLLSDLV